MKTCSACKSPKALKEFTSNRSKKDGLNDKCRPCHNAYMRAWYSRNREIHKERVARALPKRRATKYGLTVVDVDAMLAEQDGKCWLCQRKPAVVIDHCHKTGRVRGMLCHGCNTGLGKLGDSVENLQRAIAYLERAA